MQEQKTIRFEIKAFDEESGVFTGIASAYRTKPDKVNDIVDPGAFDKTIKDNKGKIMLTYPPHYIDSPVGVAEIVDSPEGLMVKGTLIDGIQKAKEAYLLMKAGVIKTLSIGYDAIRTKIIDGVRHLQEVKLYEVGLVPGAFAADNMAVITSVKLEHRLTELEEELKAGRVISKSNLQRIKNAIEALQELLEASDAEPPGTPGKDTPKSTEPPSTLVDEGAVKADRILASLQGFDSRKAETRIDNILKKIKEAQNER